MPRADWGHIGSIEVVAQISLSKKILTLDRETARIDALIEKKTRFIELLKEKRQALITHAVTKG
jgi:type I restriction enzyme S subunit